MANETNAQSDQEILGVVSGFTKIELTDGTLSSSINGTQAIVTVDSLYVMLRELKKLLDPATIDRLERLIRKHVAEPNAHGITLPLLSTSVLNEMYKAWLGYKNQTAHNSTLTEAELMKLYSSEEFFKVLFQESRIADTPTVLEGTDGAKVVSPRGINAYVQNHDANIESHADLMNFLFPGAVTEFTPTMSLMADLGIPAYMDITAPDGIKYMDASGKMRVSYQKALPVDWSMGRPTFPIFGQCKNICECGSALDSSALIHTNIAVSASDMESIDQGKAFDVSSTDDTTATDHSLSYIIDHTKLTGASFVCISIFAKAKSLSNISINTYTDAEDPYTAYRYNLNNGAVFTTGTNNTNIHADTYDSIRFVRCVYVCPIVDASKDMCVVIRPLDIFDGDFTFKGSSTDNLTLYGLQIETDRDIPSPYISTTTAVKAVSAVTPSIRLTKFGRSWYNLNQGSFMFCVNNIANIKSSLGTIPARYIFDMKLSNMTVSAFSAYYPTVNNGRMNSYFATPTGSLGSSQMFSRSEEKFVKAGIEFANRGCLQRTRTNTAYNTDMADAIFTVGNDIKITSAKFNTANNNISTAVDKLFIGCSCTGDRHLNGYLSELIYYPVYAAEDHITFYTKG